MIRGIGTDIIEIERIEKAMKKATFRKKIFTDLEIDLINEKGMRTASANFAGKEAVSKALGTGIRGFGMTDIEILRDSFGNPYVVLHNEAKEIADRYNIKNIEISLSHCKKYVVAFVIMEK